ncbi:MAG: beta-ketoacyl synthase [Dysgonamonadaceae bacterium]|nr:beta-ketoacyl synthase [Dysgonamonadaceae bacterium]
MIVKIGDNIISSLGFSSRENFQAVQAGKTGLKRYENLFNLPEPFIASMIDRERLNDEFPAICGKEKAYPATDLEKAAILSVYYANEAAGIDLSGNRVLFILSTTKGNVDLLEKFPQRFVFLWHSASVTARYFNNPNTPAVVSNACISGAAAQIAALREIESGNCDYAVVVGAEMLSKFIISGFQSFKALSPEICRPFAAGRTGLNLGEAVATIVYAKAGIEKKSKSGLIKGAVRNDANHISGPSRTAEGSFRALQNILHGVEKEDIAFINAHGTATPYNDAMEAVALRRAGLDATPVNSLKSLFGHTLGACGVLESIISMYAHDSNLILPVKDFGKDETFSFGNEQFKLNIPRTISPSGKPFFIKMLSGFGGCNAALLFGSGLTRSYSEKR